MRYFLLGILLLLGEKYVAQSTERYISLSVGMSGNTYQGDFAERNTISTHIYPGFSLGAQFYKKYNWVKSIQFGYGAIAGQIDRQNVFQPNTAGLQINPYFYTPYFHAGFRIKKLFFPYSPFHFYAESGIGGLRFTPTAINGFPLAANTDSRLEGETYSPFTYYIPAALGCIYRINRTTSLQFAYNFLYSGSDYLDNVGKLGKVKGNDAIQNIELSAIFPIIAPQNVSPNNLVISSPKPIDKPHKVKSPKQAKKTKDSLAIAQNHLEQEKNEPIALLSPKEKNASFDMKQEKNKPILLLSPKGENTSFDMKQESNEPILLLSPKEKNASFAMEQEKNKPILLLKPKEKNTSLDNDSLNLRDNYEWVEELSTIPTSPSETDTAFIEQEILWEEDSFLLAENNMLRDSMETIYERIKAQTQKAIQQGYFLYHFVLKDETIFLLSLKFHVTKDSIIELNDIENNLILEGETLKIPDVSKIIDR